jgi:hypothetical protein
MEKMIFTFAALLASGMGGQNAWAHGMTEIQKRLAISGGYLDYLQLGTEHMLTGYDHLLFLLGVIFFLTKFRDIVKFITAFTLGHSLTLVFATLWGIRANYHLVDAVIALTVCYKGFENLDGFKRWIGIPSPRLIHMVFLFGLIHGFGLSTRLQDLPIWESKGYLIIKILSFNAGVELGQIAALTLMLILLSGWRKTASFGKFAKVSNTALIIVGTLLLLMQLHLYVHQVYANDFGLNTDQHYHAHEKERVLTSTGGSKITS